jgi:hypothetical protein
MGLIGTLLQSVADAVDALLNAIGQLVNSL